MLHRFQELNQPLLSLDQIQSPELLIVDEAVDRVTQLLGYIFRTRLDQTPNPLPLDFTDLVNGVVFLEYLLDGVLEGELVAVELLSQLEGQILVREVLH